MGPNGLLFDREWALVGEDGKVLTLKKHPRLASIRPQLDLTTGNPPLPPPPISQSQGKLASSTGTPVLSMYTFRELSPRPR